MSTDIKSKLNDLQKLVGNSPNIEVKSFVNWGLTQRRNEILACSPTTLVEVQAVVKGCHQLAIRVRAVGATHTWSPLYSDEGQLVMYTKDLKRHDGPQIELIQKPDECVKYLNVMTNVTTGELMDFEISHGVCLASNVVLRVVTYGGVVTPACHGVGRDCKTVSDYITAMRIINSDGVLHTYSIDKDGEEFMLAIQANMGLFGIIYDMTFKVDNMITVTTENQFERVEKVFYDKNFAKKLFEENWSVELFWFPFNSMKSGDVAEAFFKKEVDCKDWDPKQDEVWMRLVNIPERVGDVKPQKSYIGEDILSWIQHVGLSIIEDVIIKFPGLTPNFGLSQLRSIKTETPSEVITQQLPHAVHFRDNIEKAPVYDMEWALDCDENFDNFAKATQYVIERLKGLATEGKFPVNLAMEMRLMNHSDIYLAPAQAGNPKNGGSGYTLYIEVLSLAKTPGWEEFTADVGKYWSTIPGARPHWAKQWSYIDGIDNYIQKVYKEQFPRFLEQLETSKADPDGIFFNDRLETLLYPHGHPGWKTINIQKSEEKINLKQDTHK